MSLLPPSLGIVLVCAVVGVALLVVESRWAGAPMRNGNRLSALVPAGGLWLAFVAVGLAALRLPGLPYNVRELAGESAPLTLAVLGFILLACGGLPMAFARAWRQRPALFAKLFAPLAIGVASGVFLIAWLTLPVESMDDILGSPTTGLGDTAERWLRFVGLLLGPLAGLTLGARLPLGGLRGRPFLMGLLVTSVAGLVSYTVVVPLAGTSNIVELLRGRGNALAAAGSVGYLVWLGAVVAVLGRSLTPAKARRSRAMAVSLLVLIVSVPVAWQLFLLATNPRLDKYGQVFAARQFLLSPDRDHPLDDRQISVRFGMAQLGLSVVLAGGAAGAWSAGTRRRE